MNVRTRSPRREIVKDNLKYQRVNGSYIINTDREDYEQALKRRRKIREFDAMRGEVSSLQTQMAALIEKLDGAR